MTEAIKAILSRKTIDGRFILGIGLGIILACILLSPFYGKKLSAMEIEARARSMGMVYEDEIRAISGNTEGGSK